MKEISHFLIDSHQHSSKALPAQDVLGRGNLPERNTLPKPTPNHKKHHWP